MFNNILEQTKKLCKIYNIIPARSRGQNFLIKEEVYNKIREEAELKDDDIILEVGPGLGFLTAKLAEKVKKVIAVELDDKLAEILRTGLLAQRAHPVKSFGALSAFNRVKNVEVVNKNILELRVARPTCFANQSGRASCELQNYKIVANLPYNITAVFLRKFLSAEHKPALMVLMLQKEVAERVTAKPPKMNLLAVSVQFYAQPEIIEYVPKENFWPKPEVDSAIIKFKIYPVKCRSAAIPPSAGLFNRVNEKEFFRLVKIGFSSKRKMLKNNLAAGFHLNSKEAERRLQKANFNPKIRAQELSVEDWGRILEVFR